MKKQIYNPHDKTFRHVMTYPKVIENFFKQNLPVHIKSIINFTSIQPKKDSFIDEELKLQESDLLFSADFNEKPGYLYLLIEHQSTPDKLMPLRLFKYIIAIMENHLKQTATNRLPIIYPMIFYSGRKKYNYSTDIFDLFENDKKLALDVFLKPFQLIDLSQIPDDKLKTQYKNEITMLIMKHIYDTDFLPFITQIPQLVINAEKEFGHDYIFSLISYTINTGNIKDKKKFFDFFTSNLSTVNEEQLMTLADQFRQEGLQQGMEKGKAEGKTEIAKKMLAKGIDLEEIAEITGLSLDQLSELETKH